MKTTGTADKGAPTGPEQNGAPPPDAFAAGADFQTSGPGAGRSSGQGLDDDAKQAPQLSLLGDLRTMYLSDVLLWIASRKKTGTLQLRRRSTRKLLIFQSGVLHSASSNDPRETLGQFLVRDRLITEEQLFKALLHQEEKGALLGILLVSDGLLAPDQLKRTLRAKAEQIIYDLFLWDEGSFQFQDGRMPKSVPMNLEMETQAVVAEGTRRRKRWQRIRERFPSFEVTFRVETQPEASADPTEKKILELVAAGKTLAEISLLTRRSEFDTAEYLFALCELSVLAVDRAADESTAADTVGAIQELMLLAHQALEEKRFDTAFEAYQDVLALDHLNHEAKKGLIAVSEARKRQRALRKVPPQAVPVVQMPPAQVAKEKFSASEGFLLSRINGSWDVQSILKLCPFGEEEALLIFTRLIDRRVIELRG